MMTRKRFLKVAGAGAVALAGGSLLGCDESGTDTKHWAWMDGSEPEEATWPETFARMREAGIAGSSC